jgi:SAM-dependent methyltransferase
MFMKRIEEPVLESAPLARWVAERLCRTRTASRQSCSGYHGFWQYLRLLGIVTTPTDHVEFLSAALAPAAAGHRRIRILVSGAVDYSMLACLIHSCDEFADITVIDICDTPLFLNQWYARRAGRFIRTLREDIMKHREAASYDVICAHSFLSQFPLPRRRRLVASWRELLRPGGKVITVNRIRAGSSGAFRYSRAQAEALRAAVLREAGKWRDRLDLSPEELALHACNFAKTRRIHPVASDAEMKALFEGAGFVVDHLSSNVLRAGGPLHWSAHSRDAVYANLVARRPARG